MNLNEHETARRLGLSVQTLRNWRSTRKEGGPCYLRLGRRIVYRERDLEAFENSNRIDPAKKS